jgi:hypothetical protein
MKKALLLVLMFGMSAGLNCLGTQPVLTCSNALNAGQFGFTMTIPPEFTCGEQVPAWATQRPLLVIVNYTAANNLNLAILVTEPGQSNVDNDAPNVNWDPRDPHATPSGLVFDITIGTNSETGEAIYIAIAALSEGGNDLAVFLGAGAPDDSLLDLLYEIIDSVTL